MGVGMVWGCCMNVMLLMLLHVLNKDYPFLSICYAA